MEVDSQGGGRRELLEVLGEDLAAAATAQVVLEGMEKTFDDIMPRPELCRVGSCATHLACWGRDVFRPLGLETAA